MTRRICAVTGTRAEYGMLRPVMRRIAEEDDLILQLIVTGSHLSPMHGNTQREIVADGFVIDERVEMLLASDSPTAVSTSLGLATIGFANAFFRLEPDIVVLLGDRYEVLAAAQAALIGGIPVAHIAGGDETQGAIDESIRHAVTKLSHLHFVANTPAFERVRQLGEQSQRIVVSGNPGLDELLTFEPLPTDELRQQLGLGEFARNVLVTYHPVTVGEEDPETAFEDVLAALDDVCRDDGIVFTYPNADTCGAPIRDLIEQFVDEHENAVAHHSLGQQRYWSCLLQFDAVIGNSSSGLIEAPAVGIGVVNVGRRQHGRLRPETVMDVPPKRECIADALHQVFARGRTIISSLYGDGRAADRIVDAFRAAPPRDELLRKPFQWR